MKKFTAEFLTRLRENVQLEELLSSHLTLQRTGGVSKAKCPFHKDDSPSFAVYPDHYFCFGCGARGDAVSFFEKKDGLSFFESVEKVAQAVGIAPEFEDTSPSESSAMKAHREKSVKAKVLMNWVAEVYSKQLLSDLGSPARKYLAERGYTDTLIADYGIGLALGNNVLTQSLQTQNLGFELARELKVIAENPSRPKEFRDFFRYRVMIPIHDEKGGVIAFGGRILEQIIPGGVNPDFKPPKYLNSSESFLYSKSNHLFLFNRAKSEIQKTRQAILVEGYFDALSLHRVGIAQAVAVLSASAASKGLDLLTRCRASELFLGFDDDMAGHKGVVQFFKKVFSSAQFQVRVLRFAPFKDPDEYVRSKGREGFLALMQDATPLLERVFQIVCAESAAKTSEQKLACLRKEILPEVLAMQDEALKELSLLKCAQLIGLSSPDLLLPRSLKSIGSFDIKKSVPLNTRPESIKSGGSEKITPKLKPISSEAFSSQLLKWSPKPDGFKLVSAIFFARHEDLPGRLCDLFEGGQLQPPEHAAAQLCAEALAFGLDAGSQEVLRISIEQHYFFGGRPLIEIGTRSWENVESDLFRLVAEVCCEGADRFKTKQDVEYSWLQIIPAQVERKNKIYSRATRDAKPFTQVVLDAALTDLDACSKLGSVGQAIEKLLIIFERNFVRHSLLQQTQLALDSGNAQPVELQKLHRLQEDLSQKLESFDKVLKL